MLIALLRAGGKSSTTEIAHSILAHDESQVEYYEDVTKNTVGRVLGRHRIVEKEGNGYSLLGYEDLDDKQVKHLSNCVKPNSTSTRRNAASAYGSTGKRWPATSQGC